MGPRCHRGRGVTPASGAADARRTDHQVVATDVPVDAGGAVGVDVARVERGGHPQRHQRRRGRLIDHRFGDRHQVGDGAVVGGVTGGGRQPRQARRPRREVALVVGAAARALVIDLPVTDRDSESLGSRLGVFVVVAPPTTDLETDRVGATGDSLEAGRDQRVAGRGAGRGVGVDVVAPRLEDPAPPAGSAQTRLARLIGPVAGVGTGTRRDGSQGAEAGAPAGDRGDVLIVGAGRGRGDVDGRALRRRRVGERGCSARDDDGRSSSGCSANDAATSGVHSDEPPRNPLFQAPRGHEPPGLAWR